MIENCVSERFRLDFSGRVDGSKKSLITFTLVSFSFKDDAF